MGKKCYIATRGDAEGIRIWRELAEMLRASGHTITYDWTKDIEVEQARGIHDVNLSMKDRQKYAEKDFEGVLEAEVFIYVSPGFSRPTHEKSEGAAYEMGAAHMKRDLTLATVDFLGASVAGRVYPCIVLGDSSCLFASRSDFFCTTMEEVVQKINELSV